MKITCIQGALSLILILAGCRQGIDLQPVDTENPPPMNSPSASSTETVQNTDKPVELTPLSMPTSDASSEGNHMPNLSDTVPDKLIEMVKEDLAQRLSVMVTSISLLEIEEVEWSDSSLDCPQPGMSYLQVITPGYRILLEANAQVHEYHSNKDAYIVYCENRMTPIDPKP